MMMMLNAYVCMYVCTGEGRDEGQGDWWRSHHTIANRVETYISILHIHACIVNRWIGTSNWQHNQGYGLCNTYKFISFLFSFPLHTCIQKVASVAWLPVQIDTSTYIDRKKPTDTTVLPLFAAVGAMLFYIETKTAWLSPYYLPNYLLHLIINTYWSRSNLVCLNLHIPYHLKAP